MEGVGTEKRGGARDEVTKRRRVKEGVERGGPLARDGRLYMYLDIGAGVPQFLVTPLLMGPVCLRS